MTDKKDSIVAKVKRLLNIPTMKERAAKTGLQHGQRQLEKLDEEAQPKTEVEDATITEWPG